MNNIKKIGLSALAGSLVAMSAHAELSMSGGASVALGKTHDSDKTYYYQNDSINFTYTGETDGGLTVTTKLELDGDNGGGSYDNRSVAIGSDEMGTVTYSAHGGDSVISGWDDVMPTAYEEVFALTKHAGDATTNGGNIVIAGKAGNGIWRYDSPSIGGASVHASYQAHDDGTTATQSSSYSDMGIQIAPEMVDGLTIGYATGEYDESATVLGVDVSTMWVKYVYGSITVGYQESENDGPTSATTDESKSMAISYAVNDDFSVSYGQHEYDDGNTTLSDQESTGFSASYTMGGTTIKAAFNETDNIRGVASNDEDSYEIALSFAF